VPCKYASPDLADLSSSCAGTVTRTSEVRPELFMGCFRCLECGTMIRNVEQQFKFTEPSMCTMETCQNK
jgi:DNA replication licensing factor MCM6